MEIETVVIGAGLTGLATACNLAKNGKKFLVLERSNRAGGVIQTKTDKGFTYECGPNTGIIANAAVEELFDMLPGCDPEIASPISKNRLILKQNTWYALPTGLLSAISTPLFSSRDKLRILGEPFRKRGTDKDEDLSTFVKRRLGISFLDYAVDPFIKGVYAGDPRTLIVRHALPKLYNLEQQYGSLILGSILKARDDKRNGIKRMQRSTFSTAGGLSRLTEALSNLAGDKNFVFGVENLNVIPNQGHYIIQARAGAHSLQLKTKHVVCTVPAYELPAMLSFVDKDLITQVATLEYAPVIEVALGFNVWSGMPATGFGGLIPSLEKKLLLGVLFMSSLFPRRTPDGGVLFNVFAGGMSNKEFCSLSDADVIQSIQDEFCNIMQCKSFDPSLLHISRHNAAIPQYGITTEQRLKAINQVESTYRGIIIGGNIKDGIGMADRILQAKNIAGRIS